LLANLLANVFLEIKKSRILVLDLPVRMTSFFKCNTEWNAHLNGRKAFIYRTYLILREFELLTSSL